MKVNYSNDSLGPGYGTLRCIDVGSASCECTFSICRASDQAFLSSNGEWLDTQTFLSPSRGAHVEGNDLLLAIGPEIVDQLSMTETFRLHLKTTEVSLKTVFRVTNVIYSGLSTNTLETKGPSVDTPNNIKVANTDSLGTKRPSVDSPDNTKGTNIDTFGTNEVDTDASKTKEIDIIEPVDLPSSPQAKVPLTAIILAVFVLIGAAAGGIWWYLGEGETEVKVQTEPKSEKKNTAELPQKKQSEGKSPKHDKQQTHSDETTRTEESVKAFFGGKQYTPAAAAELSRTLPRKTQTEQDAIYRLYYFAGENGESSVLMDYAACLDPSRPAWGTIQKDPLIAWKLYEKAKAATIVEAEKAMQDMRQWLEQKASEGDAQAIKWLRDMP